MARAQTAGQIPEMSLRLPVWLCSRMSIYGFIGAAFSYRFVGIELISPTIADRKTTIHPSLR
jgi:hypothetical protein